MGKYNQRKQIIKHSNIAGTKKGRSTNPNLNSQQNICSHRKHEQGPSSADKISMLSAAVQELKRKCKQTEQDLFNTRYHKKTPQNKLISKKQSSKKGIIGMNKSKGCSHEVPKRKEIQSDVEANTKQKSVAIKHNSNIFQSTQIQVSKFSSSQSYIWQNSDSSARDKPVQSEQTSYGKNVRTLQNQKQKFTITDAPSNTIKSMDSLRVRTSHCSEQQPSCSNSPTFAISAQRLTDTNNIPPQPPSAPQRYSSQLDRMYNDNIVLESMLYIQLRMKQQLKHEMDQRMKQYQDDLSHRHGQVSQLKADVQSTVENILWTRAVVILQRIQQMVESLSYQGITINRCNRISSTLKEIHKCLRCVLNTVPLDHSVRIGPVRSTPDLPSLLNHLPVLYHYIQHCYQSLQQFNRSLQISSTKDTFNEVLFGRGPGAHVQKGRSIKTGCEKTNNEQDQEGDGCECVGMVYGKENVVPLGQRLVLRGKGEGSAMQGPITKIKSEDGMYCDLQRIKCEKEQQQGLVSLKPKSSKLQGVSVLQAVQQRLFTSDDIAREWQMHDMAQRLQRIVSIRNSLEQSEEQFCAKSYNSKARQVRYCNTQIAGEQRRVQSTLIEQQSTTGVFSTQVGGDQSQQQVLDGGGPLVSYALGGFQCGDGNGTGVELEQESEQYNKLDVTQSLSEQLRECVQARQTLMQESRELQQQLLNKVWVHVMRQNAEASA